MSLRPAVRLAVVLGLLASVAACGQGGPKAAPAARQGARPVPVLTQTVVSRPLSFEVRGIGSVEAYQTVTVAARVEGAIERLDFDEGVAVTPTRILAVIDGTRRDVAVKEAEAEVSKLEASVTRAAAQTSSAVASLDEANGNLARRKALAESSPGAVPAEELATFKTQVVRLSSALDVARAQELETKADLGVAQAHLSRAREDRSMADVRSPIAGVVERRMATAGEYAKAGTALATLVDTSRLRVRFRVTEAESVRLANGLVATFTVPSIPGHRYHATLVHLASTADPSTRMVDCLADVTDVNTALKPGFFAAVSVETGGKEPAVVAPADAILPSEQGWVAFVVADGKAHKRQPTLGLRTPDGSVEILAGLAVGEELVVRGNTALEDGAPVAVQTPSSGAPAPAPVPAPAPDKPAPDPSSMGDGR